MQKLSWSLLTFMLSTTAVWADVTVKNDSNTDLALSIYSNTALYLIEKQYTFHAGELLSPYELKAYSLSRKFLF